MHGRLAEQIYAALARGEVDALEALLAPSSTWEIPGRSALAGVHAGPEAILAALRPLAVLRPIRPDAYDIAESPDHAVLMARFVGDGLDSDHALVIVADGERLARAFHYLFDLYAFDEFFRP